MGISIEKLSLGIDNYIKNVEPIFKEKIIDEITKKYNLNDFTNVKKICKIIRNDFLKITLSDKKQSLSYWVKRGWSKEEAEGNRVSRNKEWYIDKYGKEDGSIMYDTMISKMKKNCPITEENMISKYGEVIGKEKHLEWKNSCSHDLQYYISKYGEVIGKEKYNKWISSCGITEENMISKYGKEEGTKRYLEWKSKCSHNLQYYISKYGEVIGKEKFNTLVKKLVSNVILGKASKESMLLFNEVIAQCNITEKVFHGDGDNKEYFILDENGKIFFYDLVLYDSKIIIEYNGVHVHANPSWDEHKLLEWKNCFTKESSEENIKKFEYKKQLAISKGFKFLTIWSDDTYDLNIKKCVSYINENKQLI